MLTISADNLGKKFQKDWVFRGFNETFSTNESVVFLGSNGSGKSTLLQVLIGAITPSKGTLTYLVNNQELAQEFWYKQTSIAAPYLDIYQELTIAECIDTQRQFKPFINNLSTSEIIETLGLGHATNKHITAFSSGMKQRLKLGLAILADTKILALDEPTMNLDKKAIIWFQELLANFMQHRIVLTCSNEQTAEYTHANKQINLLDYKSKKA
jgi:ABC-type multidrug transport system ATPase subunit